MAMPPRVTTVLLDIDGTLLDSNAAHAAAWACAFREHGIDTDEAQLRPLIGMGADKVLPAVANVGEDTAEGRAISKRKSAVFAESLPDLRPTPGARALVEHLLGSGIEIVIATSAGNGEVSGLLKQAGVADLIPKRTSSDDVDDSKPDPDVVHAAMARAQATPEETVFVGDTPYDVEAGSRAGVRVLAVRCGGHWQDDDLRGAVMIVDDPEELLARWR
jgi:HAD superfamily hydrolase (TIGR01509 family)